MTWVFAILIAALVIKDTAPLGDSYVLRGLSEGFALCVAVGWFLTRSPQGIVRRYWLICAYVIALLLTVLVARRPVFVALQLSTLCAVILFFVALVESQGSEERRGVGPLTIMAGLYTVVCLGSLVLFVVAPTLTYDATVIGERFTGLFGKPAMMGATAGLLLGLSLFGRWHWALRITGVVMSVPCLYLTGSRTFWSATVASILITALLYVRRKLTGAVILGAGLLLMSLVIVIGDIQLRREEQHRILRAESLEHMSGRTMLWKMALEGFWDRPLLGYGFTTGADAFKEIQSLQSSSLSSSSEIVRAKSFTLHNGYVQALLDSGAFGASLYLAVMVGAFWALFRRDVRRDCGAEFYGLSFLAIANVGETIVYSAAVAHDVFYWYLAVFALGLRIVPKDQTDRQVSIADVPSGRDGTIMGHTRSHDHRATGRERRYPLVHNVS